jgi:putative transposase
MPRTKSSTLRSSRTSKSVSNPPRSRRSKRPRKGRSAQSPSKGAVHQLRQGWQKKRIVKAYDKLKTHVFALFTEEEVEQVAIQTGFRQRTPLEIQPFAFVLCCALASLVEAKRGFATVWRLLGAAAGINVVRSAVTQRFGAGSADMLQTLFELAVDRLPRVEHPELLGKLSYFKQVLADDGSVLQLSLLLGKLFPATRTNSMGAAGKLHARADLVHRRIIDVQITGERDSELEVTCERGIEPGVLYIHDLGYTCYDLFKWIVDYKADFLMRLKDNANPRVLRVRHGVRAPRRSEGRKLNDLEFTLCHDTFDLDAEFPTTLGPVELRVVGHYNPETEKYHCYVTSLGADEFTVEELEVLYSLRWIIELLFKLLKSSCHLDHLDTKDPDALRTHIYASLLASTILSAIVVAAAESAGIPVSRISLLTVGIAAPLLVIPLMILWGDREITHDELATIILRTIVLGCVDQNPGRTAKKWRPLS